MSAFSAVDGSGVGGGFGAVSSFALLRLPSVFILIRSMAVGRVIECQRSIVSMMFDRISGSAEPASADVTVDVTAAMFLRRSSDRVPSPTPPIDREDDITNKPSRFAIELFKSISSSVSSEKYSNAFLSPNKCNFGGCWPRGRVARELLPNSNASDAAPAIPRLRVVRRPVHFFAFRLTLRRRLITFLVLLMLNLLS